MRISGDILVIIAAKLHDLEQLDIEITSFKVSGHIITVESKVDQRNSRSYFVTDIDAVRGI